LKKKKLEKDWVKIFITSKMHLIQIAEALLEENEIPCITLNKVDSSYPNIGLIELLVSKNDALKSLQIIKHLINE